MGEEIGVVRRFLGPKSEVAPALHAAFASRAVDWLRERGFETMGLGVTVRLARHFGFCWGVERAVRMAHECRRAFPGRPIFLTGEIVHNPAVNRRMEELGIRRLAAEPAAGDVVLVPAFGVPEARIEALRKSGATVVDTTCGSVLAVWNRVSRFTEQGITTVIHGEPGHPETEATASRAGKFVIVRNAREAHALADEIERKSPDLERVGLANQTTMLSSESLEIERILYEAFVRRFGEEEAGRRFVAFDTICGATQERQEAAYDLIRSGIDALIVVGGRNSANTKHLVEIGRSSGVPTRHIEDASELGDGPRERPVVVGLTAGASTPDLKIGEVILRLLGGTLPS